MVQLGFRKIGDILEFRNSKDDRDAVESCLKIFTLLTGKAFVFVGSGGLLRLLTGMN